MKTMVVATDFSEAAEHALNYAVTLFGGNDIQFVLLHAYQIPLTVPSTVLPGAEMLRDKSMERLQEVAESLKGRVKRTPEIILEEGEVIDVIRHALKKMDDPWVVMGMRGNSPVVEFLIGSSTAEAIRHIPGPLIIVPRDARIEKPSRLVYAADPETPEDVVDLRPLRELVDLNHATLEVLHVTPPGKDGERSKDDIEKMLAASLVPVHADFYYEEGEDVAAMISEFADRHKADMVAMTARHNRLIDRIFHKSVTRKVALHSHIPVLSMHA